MQKRIEPMGEFVVSGREATKLLESIEESLNEVSRFVALTIIFTRRKTIVPRRDNRSRACRLNGFNKRVAVVPLVSHHRIRADRLDQGGALRDIGHLPAREDQS